MKKLTCSTLQQELQALGWRLLNRLDPFKFNALSKLSLLLEDFGKSHLKDFCCWRARNLLIDIRNVIDGIGWQALEEAWLPAEYKSRSILTGQVTTHKIHAPLRRETIQELIEGCSCPC